jgi:putative hydrolase
MPKPCLITHGDKDTVDGSTMAKKSIEWAKKEPNSEYIVVPNAGHNANQDNPTFFNNILIDFIRKTIR